MKIFAIYTTLLGVAYFIYNIYAYFSGERSLMSMIFGLLLATTLILSGLNSIFHLGQTHPRFFKYFGITFMIFAFIFFIATIVDVYLSRG